jgi:pentatricopeptide repeat protein
MRDDPQLQPDAISYNCVIGACHRAGQSTLALQVYSGICKLPGHDLMRQNLKFGCFLWMIVTGMP